MTNKVKKENLSEAAADILRASFANAKAKEDKPKRISQSGEELIGGATPTQPQEGELDANGVVKKAPYPGTNPPVSSEPRKELPGNPFSKEGKRDGGNLPGEDGGNDAKRANHGMSGVTVSEDKKPDLSRVVDGSDAANDDKDGPDDGHKQDDNSKDNKDHGDESDDKKVVKGMVKPGCMKEHVDALFSGETLSPVFKEKATAIFEGAVYAKAMEVAEALTVIKNNQLEEGLEQITESLVERIDAYLGYLAESWIQENELAVESGLRTELAESLITNLKTLFVEHYIEIPEEKVNVLEDLAETLATKEENLNEEFRKNVELRRLYNEQVKINLINQITEGLTGVQKDKISQLAEGVEFNSPEDYAGKLTMLTESYFGENRPKHGTTAIDDAANDGDDPEVSRVLNEDVNAKKNVAGPIEENPIADSAAAFLNRNSWMKKNVK